MSASANRQRAATGLKNDLLLPSRGVINADVSTGRAYSLMPSTQTEFWTCPLKLVVVKQMTGGLKLPFSRSFIGKNSRAKSYFPIIIVL